MAERKAKNTYKVTPKVWRTWSEEERLHHNKVYDYVTLRKEEFTDKDFFLEEWRTLARKVSILSAEILRRGKLAGYADVRNYPVPRKRGRPFGS